MEIPIIYSPKFDHPRHFWPGRLLAGLVATGCLTVLVIARVLTPNPSGLSTHTALRLDPCYFLARTGIPCPTCGMTTSFSWFARGNLLASFYIQPMGCVLAVLSAAGFWIGIYIAVTGRPSHRLLRRFNPLQTVIVLVGFAALAWGWKIFIHMHGIDGWVR